MGEGSIRMAESPAPIIGVVARGLRVEGRARAFIGAYDAYVEAVTACGGDPVIIPLDARLETFRVCDGVLLTGGEDPSDPRWWDDETPAGPLDARRDAFEAAVVSACERAGKPLLALCRGAQLVCGLSGGRLTRQLPADGEDHGGAVETFHTVRLRPGSRVSAAFAHAEQIEVLSRHAVFIRTLGSSLEATAWAVDGTIEAFEAREWPCVGAVWHAEWAGHDRVPDLALFRWLVATAKRRGQ
jgi:putative glutamine amidotransferase